MAGGDIDPAGIERQNAELARAIGRERPRLWNYVRRRVSDDADAEDVLQEVFGELLEAYRAFKPIEQVGAWLARVARNRIIDRFRARKPEASQPPDYAGADEDGRAEADWAELLPDPDAGPAAAYTREVLLQAMSAALEELPAAQREAFVAHELEGESFAAMARRTGVALNTLLARKHYAVRHLRGRLGALREDLLD